MIIKLKSSKLPRARLMSYECFYSQSRIWGLKCEMHQLLQSLLNCLYAARFQIHVNITHNQRPPAISNVQRAEHLNSESSILDCKIGYGLPAARKQRHVRQV